LELPHDSSLLKGIVLFAIRGKKNGKIVSDYFSVLTIILPLICLLLCLSLENRHSHLNVNVAVYFAQILRIFAQIMANFSALGMQLHPMPYAYDFLCSLE